jgi:hypothetical protein
MVVRKGGAERLTARDSVDPSELQVIRMTCPCGWCITNKCSECLPELYWEKKLYMCGCKKCCDGHPPSIGVESVSEESIDTEVEEESEDG